MKIKLFPLLLYCLLSLFVISFNISNAESTNEVSDKVVSMFIGDKEAPVTIIEYASFTCPHCATFHIEVLPKLKTEYTSLLTFRAFSPMLTGIIRILNILPTSPSS